MLGPFVARKGFLFLKATVVTTFRCKRRIPSDVCLMLFNWSISIFSLIGIIWDYIHHFQTHPNGYSCLYIHVYPTISPLNPSKERQTELAQPLIFHTFLFAGIPSMRTSLSCWHPRTSLGGKKHEDHFLHGKTIVSCKSSRIKQQHEKSERL